ncbi:hypothetical protein GCM10022243_43030 [Saccharothrix violaceirubra]|uniref:Acyl-coenzyme A synthetase/AMP-(Fatty) acid ligase n=1 Tax=Saccharothrix violaceirubra TaxID=413306 RepID=A0A7W7T3H1_9PSEU|nr:acyl-CoA synthetase [Saccharothrix violaceirubra]MBB4965591.1 acyl-coenzyme A synthetase/AMP-(fatty) acid ligase [Saccharothrix violaceirubra]
MTRLVPVDDRSSGAAVPHHAEFPFSTSGHTGTPAVWLRTEEQLHAETALIADAVIGDVDQVVSFAPREHLFGRLFAEILPARLDIPVVHVGHDPVGLPPEVAGRRTLFVCLPSSWLVLRHMLRQVAELPAVVALHGTGPTVPATAQVVDALADTGFRAVELFGSTETGGIAQRRIVGRGTRPAPWTLLPDVEFVDATDEADQWLHIRGPRLARRADMAARPTSWRLPDLVRRVGPRSFEFDGRASALIKVNGRRCNLEELSTTLRTLVPGLDVACLPVRDPVRAEHYELFYSATGPDPDPRQVLDRLGAAVADFTPPRAVHRVPLIPRTATGKIAVAALYAQAVTPTGHDRRAEVPAR